MKKSETQLNSQKQIVMGENVRKLVKMFEVETCEKRGEKLVIKKLEFPSIFGSKEKKIGNWYEADFSFRYSSWATDRSAWQFKYDRCARLSTDGSRVN